MRGKLAGLLLAFLFLFGLAAPAQADGIIIPPPLPCPGFDCPPGPPRPVAQLVIRYHHVTVTIEDQLAVTRVDQVFYNPNDWVVEGTYVFPLPVDAAVSDFTLWVDGQPVSGEVLSAEEARRYYDEVVRSLRDPALLEYVERSALRASLFPIPPGGERRIELEYTQALTAENGLFRYVYPLNTEKFSAEPLEDVSIRVEVRDRQAIRAVYSPSHAVGLDRWNDNHVVAGYEAKNVLPDADFSLYYSLGASEAFHLFSYRNPADPLDPDGFFMLLLAPKPGENPERIDKDVLLVLDRSGSMDGEKFQQAQEALRYILRQLNPQDRFYLQAFSTGMDTYASGLRPASEVNEALGWVDRLSAVGSTDINRALLEAAAVVDEERPTYLIFLTDGLPTEGVVDTEEILRNFAASAPENLRLFAFGVGYDVDTILLDTLSQEHHGLSSYVRPGEPLDEVVSAFYQRISTPVLTDLALDFGDLSTYDLYPDPLPDLFAGSQVIVVGRYREGGSTNVTLRGEVNGQEQVFRYDEQRFAADSRGQAGPLELLPRLWATRKIGFLLNRIRLEGPQKETIEQIVRLSIRYGIVTPYTSYLVKDPMPLGQDAQERIVEEAFGAAEEAPMEASGKSAVDRAAQEGELQGADVAPALPQPGELGEAAGTAIRVVGPRTFVFQEEGWVDTTFDPQQMTAQDVVFLSDSYYRLLDARPDLAAALALGDQVTVVVDGQAYRVVAEGDPGGSVKLPPELPSTAEPAQTQPAPEPTGPAVVAVEPAQAEEDVPPQGEEAPNQVQSRGPCLAAGLAPLLLAGLIFGLRKKQG
jgi:Ca-activated chloride channel family protein